MSRAASTYKSKRQLKNMTVKEADAYIKVLKDRAQIGGYVTKSAEKQLEVVRKVRSAMLVKALVGDA